MSGLFSAAWAQPSGAGPGGPGARDPHLRVHAVRVFVRDQERSLRFYLDQLGFRLAYDARLESGQRWVAISPPDGSTVLSLIQPPPKSAEHKLIGRSTQVVFVTEDFPAKFHEWHQRGVKFRHTPRLTRIKYDRRAPARAGADTGPVWGGMFARFEDLDGNSFTLASFDEESRAVEAQRRALAEKNEAERRAAHELDIARQVQARLFPQRLPPSRTLDYAGRCLQARQVGGDYYDFLDLGQDRLGLVVGDIAGKGIAAALLMAHLQATLRSQCAIALREPERFLRSVNQLFRENTIESAYATLFFAEYDDRARRLRYANCGHLCGLVLRPDGRVDRLQSTSTVLGLFDDWECGIGEETLGGGDVLALYTDGVTEAFNDGGDEFGEGRLVQALGRSRERPAEGIVDSVLDDLRRFSPHEQHDDITLIVARCRA
jgi:serine phosphatase RsbU (regulator of sigma subunit)/catechol 2,3-dioxygenase-like lactoylglutathione lyase family enzyme